MDSSVKVWSHTTGVKQEAQTYLLTVHTKWMLIPSMKRFWVIKLQPLIHRDLASRSYPRSLNWHLQKHSF